MHSISFLRVALGRWFGLPILPVLALLLAAGCATQPGPRGPEAHNLALIQRYFDEWANHGSEAAADELIAPDLVLINPPSTTRSLADYKKGMATFHAGFPDLHFTVEDRVAAADKVVVRWRLTGTHRGEFLGRPPSGRTFDITGTSTFRIADGRIREIWVNMDRLAMQQQLGWLPGPAAAGAAAK